ncbi:TIGR04222 domain-containing membrane protein [Cryptosporangium phraense]|uniref:TIGR04222 domain-containing membrane protein n=1 Tax=Cryptosporangium phraense TaxID=2593070 RepID=A0A545ASI1_9ACTN|nr:TIGR04222 domain-containing membrane protein [Cryptosporangium phraense]TQS44290.1 TIGR04222 domain-containing membrane protein [Cryptosporangium phraense]
MKTLAAPGDTWGIPGPTFLFGLTVLGVAAIGLTLLLRRGISRGRAGGAARPVSDPFALALLSGGVNRVVEAAIAGLRARGLVDAVSGGGVTVRSWSTSGLHPVELAVHHAIGNGCTRVWTIAKDPGVVSTIEPLRTRLELDGLFLSASQRTTFRLVGLLVAPVIALGVLRALAGSANGKPISNLLFLLVFLGLAQLFLLRQPAPLSGRAVRETIRAESSRNSHLQPSYNPSWAAYGAGGAALGVALFGTASLIAADPAFAAEAQIRQAAAANSSGSYVDSGGSSCSSSSSCSGGSSCGGGGCGGGGCGG